MVLGRMFGFYFLGLKGRPLRFASSRSSVSSERRLAATRSMLRLFTGTRNLDLRARITTPLCCIFLLNLRSRLSKLSLSLRFTSTNYSPLSWVTRDFKPSTFLKRWKGCSHMLITIYYNSSDLF